MSDYWINRGPDNLIMTGYLPGGVNEGKRDAVYQAVTDALMEHEVTSVLDVGGNVALLGIHFQKVGYEPNYVVVDSNPHAVAWCHQNGFEAEVGDANNLEGFRKNQKSAVVLMAVLDHLPDFRPGLREAFRVARDVVVVDWWKNPPGDVEVIRPDPRGFYENTYAHDDIEELADECGWEIESSEMVQGNNAVDTIYVFVPKEG